MKRFAKRRACSSVLVLATSACGPNITPLGEDPFALTLLADFENGKSFNPDSPWSGNFAMAVDRSVVPEGYAITFDVSTLSPPRTNPDSTMSTKAMHAADDGVYTIWGTSVLADLKDRRAVDLGAYLGFSIWARSAGKAGTTVKVGFADYGSFDQVADLPKLCDDVNTTGPNACFDDYAAKIYPDGMWRRYDIPFSSLTTGGYGYPHVFDQTHVYRIKLSMPVSTKYDLWFDDAAFMSPRMN